MSTIFRLIFAILVPPLAVIDKGWDKLAITALLWFTTGIGGPLAALYFSLDGTAYDRWRDKNFGESVEYIDPADKPKRDGRRFIEVADGDVLEVVDTAEEERRTRLSS